MKKKETRALVIIAASIVIAAAIAIAASTILFNPPGDSMNPNSDSQEPQNPNNDNAIPPVDQNDIDDDQTQPDDNVDNDNLGNDSNDIIDVSAFTEKAIVGNILDVGLVSGMSAVFIEDNNDMISVRFTSKYSGEVTTLVTYFQQEGTSTPTLEVGLQTDNGIGKPSGDWMNEGSFGTMKLDHDGFTAVTLRNPVTIQEGKIYHVVARIPAADSGAVLAGKIPMVAYNTGQPYQPLNEDQLDLLWPDPAIDILRFDGREWREENQLPLFVIKFADGKAQGQPYSLAAPWIIYGPRHVGQTFVPSSTYLLEKFAFVVNTKGGSQDKLYYEIRDSENKIISEGIFAENDTLSKSKQWVEVTLPSPIKLDQGKLYRIALFSPDTAEPNSYQLYGHEFTYDVNLGYGGTTQMLSASYTSGRSWERWEDADSIFRLSVSQRPSTE